MNGIKDLVGLLFWMDNTNLSTMKAVSNGQRKLSQPKRDILRFAKRDFIPYKEADRSARPGAASKVIK